MFAQDNKVIFEFHPYKCFVKCQASKQVLLEGFVGTDGLYQFQPLKFLVHKSASNHDFKSANVSNSNNSNTSSIACNSANSFVNSFQNWHLRLGHNHANAVKSVLNLCKIPFNNKNVLEFCNACSVGKSHKLHAPPSLTIHSTPFEVIHCDLWGPAPSTSYFGYNYYITL
jgi:hypothetical protein